MSLNCFFGLELKPDGVPVTPVIPLKSSLVITQCAVTSVVPPAGDNEAAATASSSPQHLAKKPFYGSVTLYVQSHAVPSRFAVCTLSPTQNVVFSSLQLILDKRATFTLVPQPVAGSSTCVYPTVHLTGYYESEQSEEDEEESEAALESESEATEEEAQPVARRGGSAQHQQQSAKKGGEGERKQKRLRGG